MADLVKFLQSFGWRQEVAEVLAECFEHDHPAVRIKAEPQEADHGDLARIQSESDGTARRGLCRSCSCEGA